LILNYFFNDYIFDVILSLLRIITLFITECNEPSIITMCGALWINVFPIRRYGFIIPHLYTAIVAYKLHCMGIN